MGKTATLSADPDVAGFWSQAAAELAYRRLQELHESRVQAGQTVYQAFWQLIGLAGGLMGDAGTDEIRTLLPDDISASDARNDRPFLTAENLDWKRVSPAVLGRLYQSWLGPEPRRNLGAHYTAEVDVMKVLDGLFLDTLRAQLDAAGDDRRALEALHRRLGEVRVLDPACGCGIFLLTAYQQLRCLEAEICRRLGTAGQRVFPAAMRGIELEEGTARIARLSVWLAARQLDCAQGRTPQPVLPPRVIQANALRLDWERLASRQETVFVAGNPPFVAKNDQNPEQRADMALVCGKRVPNYRQLDYACGWFVQAARLMRGTDWRAAFVATNSITQGEQTGLLWQPLLEMGMRIHFAHRPFRWKSGPSAPAAGVQVVVIGFGPQDVTEKRLYDYVPDADTPRIIQARHINPYLADSENLLLSHRDTPLGGAPPIRFGSMPNDGGHLLLSDGEKALLVARSPETERWIRPLITGKSYLNGCRQWCLWLKDFDLAHSENFPAILERIAAVRRHRQASRRAVTRALAELPHLFGEIRQPDTPYVLVPLTTSEQRFYIPMGFFGPETIVHNTCAAVPVASRYHFGVLSSRMHMSWTRQVCGRLEGRIRYSNRIVYNNFPWPPEPSSSSRQAIEAAAGHLLAVRQVYLTRGRMLATLYDPDAMPTDLAEAHRALDAAVDECYGVSGTMTEPDRVVFLFGLRREMFGT